MIVTTDAATIVVATEIVIPEGQIAIAAQAHDLTEIAEMIDIARLLLLIGEGEVAAVVVQAVVVDGAIEDPRHHYLEMVLILHVEDHRFLLYLQLTVEGGMHQFLKDHTLVPDLEVEVVVVVVEAMTTDATTDLPIRPQDEKDLLHG